MDQQNKELEELHRQASTLYLQGEYGAALQTWRQLLQIEPKDERAREGARLCELLVQEDGTSAPGLGQPQTPDSAPAADSPAPSAPATTPAVGFAMGEDLDESLDELDELLGEGSGSDWMDATPGKTEAAESPEQIEFDVSEVAAPQESPPTAAESPSPAPTAGDATEAGFEFNFEGTDQQAASGDETGAFDFTSAETEAPGQPPIPAEESPQAAAASAASAEELQRRTNELMAEAMEHYERSEREEALAALSRLAILDENDEAARAFADHIRTEIEELTSAREPEAAGPEAPIEMPPETEAASAQDLNHEPLEFLPMEDEDSGLALDPAGAPEDQAGEPLQDAAVGEAVEPAETPAKNVGGTSTRVRKLSVNQWLMVAAAASLVLGGSFAVLQFTGGSKAPTAAALAAPPPLSGSEPPTADPPVGSDPPAANAGPERAPAVPLPVATAEIEALLRRAEGEMETGNYAAAVLTYNEALVLDPEDPAIQSLLLEAGELYQEQKETLAQRRMAIQAFNEGDYRNSLRLLYRLEPVDEDEARRFRRYKRNGWFNLGLRALKSGDCRMARSHLREARQVDPGDPGVLDALELSEACFESKSQAFFDSVRPLSSRGLDD